MRKLGPARERPALASDCAWQMRRCPMVNRLAAQARIFHCFATLHRKKETNQVSPSFHPHVVSWGARQLDEGRFLPNKANGRNASSLNELSLMAASHRVFPSIIAVIPCYLPVILRRDPGFAGTSSGLALLISCFNRHAGGQRPDALIALRTGHGGG